MALAVAAVPVPDYESLGRPSPSMDITITDVTGARLTVWRSHSGGRQAVRGAVDQVVVGTIMAFTDYEAPFGVPITYQVSTYTTGGAVVASAQSGTATLVVDQVWISDPLVPSSAARVTLDVKSLGERSYSVAGDTVDVEGSQLPVAVAGTRGAASRMPVNVLCYTDMQTVAALNVVRYAAPFLIRTPARLTLDPLAYCHASEVREVWVDKAAGGGTTRVEMNVTLVQPPGASVIVPVRTYDDVLAEASTYSDVIASRATYLAVLRG